MNILHLSLAISAALLSPIVCAQSATTPTQEPSGALGQVAGSESPILFNFAGYADVTYIRPQGSLDAYGVATLAPIFQLLIKERIFLETELELEVDDHGNRETAVEYATFNWLINDNLALVAGKFLSPVGYFFQNQHPSWVNKLASKPAGFGHGGANPISDVGVQLRGGKLFANGQQLNYAIYNSNGPQLGLEIEGMAMAKGATGEPEFALDLDSTGRPRNPDGKRTSGGRIGWLPVPDVEIGASLARGDVVLDAGELSQGVEPSRTYQADGIDAVWHATKALELRGEWIRQRVGDAPTSIAPDQTTWRAWYAQGAYRWGNDRWETVLRYGDSVSPHAEATYKQTAIGLNYLFRPNAIAKLTWQFNDSADPVTNANALLLQFAYGF